MWVGHWRYFHQRTHRSGMIFCRMDRIVEQQPRFRVVQGKRTDIFCLPRFDTYFRVKLLCYCGSRVANIPFLTLISSFFHLSKWMEDPQLSRNPPAETPSLVSWASVGYWSLVYEDSYCCTSCCYCVSQSNNLF